MNGDKGTLVGSVVSGRLTSDRVLSLVEGVMRTFNMMKGDWEEDTDVTWVIDTIPPSDNEPTLRDLPRVEPMVVPVTDAVPPSTSRDRFPPFPWGNLDRL